MTARPMLVRLERISHTPTIQFGRLVDAMTGVTIVPATLEPYPPIEAPGTQLFTRFLSPHFGYPVWRSSDGRAVEFHVGNYLKDTEGCALVGMRVDPLDNAIWDSVTAFQALMGATAMASVLQVTYVAEVSPTPLAPPAIPG